MKKYSKNDIISALKNAEIEESDIVMMHSSPITLGRFDGENVTHEIISTIREFLGSNGTLVVPTFNFDFCKGEAFNRQKSPSKNMGVLSETVRLLPDSIRSIHPMQSIVANGKYCTDICERDTPSAFSIGGSFDRLLQLNAKLLLFGANFNAASFFHYAEERLNVPYRFFKKFSGEYIDNDISQKREYEMFVRDMDLIPLLDLRGLDNLLQMNKKLKKSELGMGEIIVCSFKDLLEQSFEILQSDPLFFLKNKNEIAEKLNLK